MPEGISKPYKSKKKKESLVGEISILGKNTSISFGGQGSNLVMGFDEKGSLLDIFNDKKSDNVLEIFKGGKK